MRALVAAASEHQRATPLLVTLNRANMPGETSHFVDIGDHASALGWYVGQNGLHKNSYTNDTGANKLAFLRWAETTKVFFETTAATSATVGTLDELVDAGLRVDMSFLNLYASDVLKGTVASDTYDPVYGQALERATTLLGP